jgi:hypothetical protein
LKRGADGKEKFTVLEGRGFHRICAPYEEQTKRATAVFIWEKADPEDLNLTPEKIVSPFTIVAISTLTFHGLGRGHCILPAAY